MKEQIKTPFAISLGLFLFLFGLAFAKAMKTDGSPQKQPRLPASQLKSE